MWFSTAGLKIFINKIHERRWTSKSDGVNLKYTKSVLKMGLEKFHLISFHTFHFPLIRYRCGTGHINL
jgi:hypothetical protein